MNIAQHLTDQAKKHGNKKAIIVAKKISFFKKWFSNAKKNSIYPSITFKDLEILASKYAYGLKDLNAEKGDRVILFLRPGPEFIAATFALFKCGLVPVFIDPGMGLKNALTCIENVSPKILICENEIHYLLPFLIKKFRHLELIISKTRTFSPIHFYPGLTKSHLKKMTQIKNISFDAISMQENECAAILFTSGGTGKPKGVEYSHSIFDLQIKTLQEMFRLTDNDVDLAAFPLFALFTLSMGMTSIVPDMDPSKPKKSNPKKLYHNIEQLKPTFVAGSPAIWEDLSDFCLQNKLTCDSVKSLVMFGAPIPIRLHQKFQSILTSGTTYTPYGATECLPISNFSGSEILKSTKDLTINGRGICVGRISPHLEIKIIKQQNNQILSFDQIEEMMPLAPGEIIVAGGTVTHKYFQMENETRLAKIHDPKNNKLWHRMGDVGYLDDDGRLWFLGRAHHVVQTKFETYYPIAVEAIFNQHPEVYRSALIPIKNNANEVTEAAIVIERKDREYLRGQDKSFFESELIKIATKYPHTKNIKQIFYSLEFPVDVRYNIKIDRQKLAREVQAHLDKFKPLT